jgi:hypothetical protein
VKALAVVVVCLLALTACSGTASAPIAAPSKTASPAPRETFSTVIALRDAFLSAGGVCDAWTENDLVTLAAQSADCSDDTVLSIYVSQAEISSLVADMKSSGFETHLLVGKNWIINTPRPEDFVAKLGGTVVTTAASTE